MNRREIRSEGFKTNDLRLQEGSAHLLNILCLLPEIGRLGWAASSLLIEPVAHGLRHQTGALCEGEL